MNTESLFLRVNGVLPDIDSDAANTSVSVHYQGFHLLVDAGNGVRSSLQKSATPGARATPDTILITNSKKQHIIDLPNLVEENTKIYCTANCSDQITKILPSLDIKSVSQVSPGVAFDAGPFKVTPIAADNAGDQPGLPGSVIYVIRAGDKKIVAGWDFLKLPNADESIFWNPDVLMLGTETYNDHPSTGMISISEAYNIVRRWNAKTSYVLHYSGQKDREDAKNQWHRGPTEPLSPDALQTVIDDHLRVSGGEGKHSITVAREGMIWTAPTLQEEEGAVGPRIEVDALDRHSFAIEKTESGKVVISVEDSISRITSEFINPRSDGNSLHGEAIKSMMMKGPELELVVADGNVRIDIIKGKKAMFAKSMEISQRDSKKLKRYLDENFQKVQTIKS